MRPRITENARKKSGTLSRKCMNKSHRGGGAGGGGGSTDGGGCKKRENLKHPLLETKTLFPGVDTSLLRTFGAIIFLLITFLDLKTNRIPLATRGPL